MKLIARIKGGLGNQLFCYAAARRLALINDAELVIDNITGFQRDFEYRRNYALDNFNISARKANPSELLEPLSLFRRKIFKFRESFKPFMLRSYIFQEFPDFDIRLLEKKIFKNSVIDGLWQSEGYFNDILEVVRGDLAINPPVDITNHELSTIIRQSNSVGLHIRKFSQIRSSNINLSENYYLAAIKLILEEIDNPLFFIFSDDHNYAKSLLGELVSAVYVTNNTTNESAYADLWLMSLCKHFIMANSTFSWWGSWLGGSNSERLIFFPRLSNEEKHIWSWDFQFQMPINWIPIQI